MPIFDFKNVVTLKSRSESVVKVRGLGDLSPLLPFEPPAIV